jgi:transcriptional regulator GlxA family with amidase domain
VRESTDTYAGAGVDVRSAYSYLRTHFREKNCASLVAQNSATPARTLQDRFKKSTGRTLSQEITRLRLEHACHLLEHTQLKVTSVAHETGFASYAYFSGLFERTFSMKPSAYRDSLHRVR